MAEIHALLLLFLVAIASASFFPSQAELVLFALLAMGDYDPLLLVLAATAGNGLGSLANYYAGRYISKVENKRWFPIKPKYLEKPKRLFAKHGTLSLLLAGVPFIGNPITVVAGMMRVNIWLFLSLVTAGKSVRYFLAWAIYALIK